MVHTFTGRRLTWDLRDTLVDCGIVLKNPEVAKLLVAGAETLEFCAECIEADLDESVGPDKKIVIYLSE